MRLMLMIRVLWANAYDTRVLEAYDTKDVEAGL